MQNVIKQPGPNRGLPWRILLWGAAAAMLLAPWVAMRFSAEVNWDATDFIVFGLMLAIAGGSCELAVRISQDRAYRAAAAITVGAGFLITWVNLAVGIIGDEDNPANLMYFGVLGVGFIGALLARFRPAGMAHALTATAIAQLAVGLIALYAESANTLPLTAFFMAAWLLAAALFRKAARHSLP